jgi:hypothetical protein
VLGWLADRLTPAANGALSAWGDGGAGLGDTPAAFAGRLSAGEPRSAARFQGALDDDLELAGDPAGRLEWFYRRMPWFDAARNLYPIAREPAPADSRRTE